MIKQSEIKFSKSKQIVTRLIHGDQLKNWPVIERLRLIDKIYNHLEHCTQCHEDGTTRELSNKLYIWQMAHTARMASIKKKTTTPKICPECKTVFPDGTVFCVKHPEAVQNEYFKQ
jgi:hypothetical protein